MGFKVAWVDFHSFQLVAVPPQRAQQSLRISRIAIHKKIWQTVSTAVLEKDDFDLLWPVFNWHQSCHGNIMVLWSI